MFCFQQDILTRYDFGRKIKENIIGKQLHDPSNDCEGLNLIM